MIIPKHAIPIAFACDSNYFNPMIVTITSLLMNANKGTFYHIFILKDSFTEDENQKLKYFENHYPCVIDMRIVTNTIFDIIEKDDRLTNPNFYRFYMIDMITEYDKVIWCDTDIVINGDLTDYFNIPIEDNYLVVSDSLFETCPIPLQIYKPLKEERHIKGKLFNAGFITLNLKKMKEDTFIDKLLEWYKKYQFNTTEQALWNTCDQKVVYTDLQYNVMIMPEYIHFYEEVYLDFYHEYVDPKIKKQIINALNNPIVLHYVHMKPWKTIHNISKCIASWADIWWTYYKKSHVYDHRFYLTCQYNLSKEIQRDLLNSVYQDEQIRRQDEQIKHDFWYQFGQLGKKGKILMLIKKITQKLPSLFKK